MRAAQDAQSPRMPNVDPGRWWKALIAVAYNSALRIDCLMRLEWSMLDWDSGWLEVPAEIYKGHEHGGTFYLNTAARKVLEPLKEWGYTRIFPWRSYPDSSSWLQEQRRRLWCKAGIDLPGCGFHTLRRTVLTWIAGQNDTIASIVAGHAAGRNILQGHYVNKEKVVPPMLERVPQPVDQTDQMELFDGTGVHPRTANCAA